jgi:hypothetical protein
MVEKPIRQCLVTDNSDVTRLLIGNGADEIPVSGRQSGKAVVELNLPGRRATIGPDLIQLAFRPVLFASNANFWS